MFEKRKWKKIVCVVLSLLFFMPMMSVTVSASEYWPEGPFVESPSVILMEASTGTILYQKESLQRNFPASITKIMTTLIALENSDLSEIVTFSDNAIDKTEGSSISRDYGEQMTMEQCLYAVMLTSANECAYAVAEHVAGTMEAFVDMMNAKAAELGCMDTHFVNPHGLFDENHYTCAYDMALIARAAYENETFRIITGTARYTIPPTNKHKEETPLQNHNEMLYPWQKFQYRYDNCTGGKTGYTEIARSTLVTYAEKDGMTLVCVVMHTETPNQWLDSRSMFDYGFDNFQLLNIADNETKYKTAETVESGALNNHKAFVDLDETANIVLPKTAEFSDADSVITYDEISEDVVGTILYTYAGHDVGRADIVKTGVVIEGHVFDNQKAEATNTAPEADEGNKDLSAIRVSPQLFLLAGIAFTVLAILLLYIKKFVDNFYIIRHNMEVRRYRREQFREIRQKKRTWWRRRR